MSRIILSPFLLFYLNNKVAFLLISFWCGLSDILDGYIARKTKTESEFGARLDSFADLVLFIILIVSVILKKKSEILSFLPHIASIFLIRMLNLSIVYFKHRQFAILHTSLNKLTGFLAFISFFSILVLNTRVLVYISIFIGYLSAIEEFLIHLISRNLNTNIPHIFQLL